MTKNSCNAILSKLKLENENVLKDLNECQKRINFLQKFIINYRKILVEFSHKCVCNQSNDIINSMKSIEFQYKELFFNDDNDKQRQSMVSSEEQTVNDICDESEEPNHSNREEEEEEEVENTYEEESVISDNEKQIYETFDNNIEKEVNNDMNAINSDNSVLVFNKLNNTIIKKIYENMDTNNEFLINSFVIKKAENLINDTIDKVINKTNETTNHDYNTKKKSKVSKKSNLKPKTYKRRFSEPELNEKTTLLPIPSLNSGNVQHFIAKVEPKPKDSNNIMNSKEVSDSSTIERSEEQNREEKSLKIISIIDGKVETLISDPIWSENSLKSSKKYFDIFNALIEELKTGRIDSFIDPKHNLISVFLRNIDSNDGQNLSEIVFKCSYSDCEYESNCKKYIRSHVLRHENNKTFICNFCEKVFESKISFIEHRIEVHKIDEKRLFKCEFPECHYKTTNKQSIELHSITHQTDRTVRCDVIGCQQYFKSVFQMKSHRKTVHVLKDFHCEWPGCEANFKTRSALKIHLMSHNGQNKTVNKIREILKNGNYVSTLHKNNSMFSVIRQKFINESEEKYEMGPKVGYKCNYITCHFVSVLPHLMFQHINTHSTGKKYECHLCQKTFALRKYWTQHQKYVHNINNNCPLLFCKYPECNYQTRNAFSFKSHSAKHRTDTPFKCDQKECQKEFKTKYCLKQHLVYSHTIVKPFVCEFPGCESAFKMKTNLNRHMKTHSFSK